MISEAIPVVIVEHKFLLGYRGETRRTRNTIAVE